MLNRSAVNSRSLNMGVRPIPEALAADAIAAGVAELTSTRVRSLAGDAVSLAVADFVASAQRYGGATFISSQLSQLDATAIRNASGTAIAETAAGLYYTRIVYGTGGALISVIAISDIGVVYGEGSGIMLPTASLDGRRAKAGYSDAVAITSGELAASAIRHAATASESGVAPLHAALDTAHITGLGVRYINGSGDAIGYINLVDGGLKRQVLIGSLDLEPIAYGAGSAIRNATGSAAIESTLAGDFFQTRRAEGAGMITGHANLAGEILVTGTGEGVISLIAQLTGYVYRRTAILDAISEVSAELYGLRAKAGRADAVATGIIDMDGRRVRLGVGDSIVILNAESDAQDFNFVGLDDDDEIFFRPASDREFARPETEREWRRS